MKEIWKDIPGYEGLYQVSNAGNVKSLNYHKTGKAVIMTLNKHDSCYMYVGLRKDGRLKSKVVHRLVWEAFNGPIPEGMVINHKDENPANNRLDNLMVCTQKENCNWGTRNERIKKNVRSKWVIQLNKNNEILHFYQSTMQASRETGISRHTIMQCCNKRIAKRKYKDKEYCYIIKNAGGFIWKYAE